MSSQIRVIKLKIAEATQSPPKRSNSTAIPSSPRVLPMLICLLSCFTSWTFDRWSKWFYGKLSMARSSNEDGLNNSLVKCSVHRHTMPSASLIFVWPSRNFSGTTWNALGWKVLAMLVGSTLNFFFRDVTSPVIFHLLGITLTDCFAFFNNSFHSRTVFWWTALQKNDERECLILTIILILSWLSSNQYLCCFVTKYNSSTTTWYSLFFF